MAHSRQADSDLRSLTEHIAAGLTEGISSGRFRAGDRIVEAEIASQFQASHGPVRDALRLLHKQGLVEVIPRRGARVVGQDEAVQSDIPPVLGALIRVAFAQAFTTHSVQSSQHLRENLRAHIDHLSKLTSEPFVVARFVQQLEKLCAVVVAASGYVFLPRFWARQMMSYRAHCSASLVPATAQTVVAAWKNLADQEFEFQKGSVLETQKLFGKHDGLGRSQSSVRLLIAIRSPRIPDYPEVQSYLDAVDDFLQVSSSLHPTLSVQIASKLRERIQTGEYGFGDRFTEIELSNLFLASRGPVRDALRILDEEGLIDLRPRRGAIVRRMPPRELTELYDIREAIGDLCARLAARNGYAPPRWTKLFDEGLDLMERVWKGDGIPAIVWLGLRRTVSKLVYFRADNLAAFALAREIENRLATHYLTHGDRVRRSIVLRNWRRIRDAIVNGDEDVAGITLGEAIRRSKEATLQALKYKL
jgi:DNA-binding GntR family transcriptional regulator